MPASAAHRPRRPAAAMLALALLVLLGSALPAGAQRGTQSTFECDTAGLELKTHNLRTGELNLPVTCEYYDEAASRQAFAPPSKVEGKLTVSEGVRKRLGLTSKVLTKGEFDGPKTYRDGRLYANWWRKTPRSVRAKLRQVQMMPFSAELRVTQPDGQVVELEGTFDATNGEMTPRQCKYFGRMRYACKGL